jgi:integrase
MTLQNRSTLFPAKRMVLEGMPPVSPHKLRHSHASQLLLPGVHPKVVQEPVGHSSISVTLDIYSHPIPTIQEDAAARLDAAYQPAVKGKCWDGK